MVSLRDMGQFVGLDEASPIPALKMPIAFTSIKGLIPDLSDDEKTSMQALNLALLRLPPISLEASIKDAAGEVPIRPLISIKSSSGLILETRIWEIVGGVDWSESQNYKAQELNETGVITFTNPGWFQLEVRRVGITGTTGLILLKKTFNIYAHPKPAPPPPPPPVVKPSITVSVNNNNAGSFKVSGTGFLPQPAVTIRIVNSDGVYPGVFIPNIPVTDGKIDYTTEAICPYQGAHLVFSAKNGPIDINDGDALISNYFNITCT